MAVENHCRSVCTNPLLISIESFYRSVSVIQSYYTKSTQANQPLFFWRAVRDFDTLNMKVASVTLLYAPEVISVHEWYLTVFRE